LHQYNTIICKFQEECAQILLRYTCFDFNFALPQVTVAILLNSFVGAINAAEEEAAAAAAQDMKSKEMLRFSPS
jgi:hypothetical protein